MYVHWAPLARAVVLLSQTGLDGKLARLQNRGTGGTGPLERRGASAGHTGALRKQHSVRLELIGLGLECRKCHL